jgi:hypothetical protein
MTAEAATSAMPAPENSGAPATVTMRRSWAIGALLTVAVVIVAMAIALAAVAGDDGADGPGGFPPGAGGFPPGAPPSVQGTSEGYGPPPGVMPEQGGPGSLPTQPGN